MAPERSEYELTESEVAFVAPMMRAIQEMQIRITTALNLLHTQHNLQGNYVLSPDNRKLIPGPPSNAGDAK